MSALDLRDQHGQPLNPKAMLAALSVQNIQGTNILEIAYQSADPQEPAIVIGQLIKEYQNSTDSLKRSEATSKREFIEQQLPKAELEIRRLELTLRQFKEQNNIVDLATEAEGAVSASVEFQTQTTQLKSQIAAATTRIQALRSKIGVSAQQGADINALSQSPAIQRTLNKRQQLETQLDQAQAQLQPGHPLIKDLEEQLASNQRSVQQKIGQILERPSPQPLRNLQAGDTQQELVNSLIEAEVEHLALGSQIADLQRSRAEQQSRIDNLPRLEQQRRELERKLLVAQTVYAELSKAFQQTRINESQENDSSRVIEPAQGPGNRIPSRLFFNVLAGILLGSLLGVGVALLLEVLDHSIKTVREVKAQFDYVVLGQIPRWKQADFKSRRELDPAIPALIVRNHPRSAMSEAYRMLQANLKFLSSDHPIQAFVVTSSVPKEGKSTVVANLALALAELGHRVLIVDADLRHPTQHKAWELPNTRGLSNVLVDQQDWSDTLAPETETLDILTAGAIPPTPVPLLDSERMASLLKAFQRVYDYVLIDSPPLAVAADALLLSKMTDGLLMVTRPGMVESGSAQSARETLEKSNHTVLGLVINGVIPENEPDSYYYYYAKDYYDEELGGQAVEPLPLGHSKARSDS